MQEQASEHGSKDKSKQANKQRALIYVNFKVQFTGGRQFLEELKVQIYEGNEVLLTTSKRGALNARASKRAACAAL